MSRRLPPLESLRFFEACARHSSFTRAATELGITPAAVSLRIRDLESDVGVRLFHRSGPKIELTGAGAALAGRMTEAMRQIRAAVEACRSGADALRVTVAPTFATRWLAPRLARYQARPGAVPISLDASTELRASQSFDVAIRSGVGEWPGLVASLLLPVEGTPMLSPALASVCRLSSPGDLAALPLLADENWPRWFGEVGVDASRLRYSAVSYPTQELAASAAVEGAGVALLSPTLFGSLVREGKLVRPFEHVTLGGAAYWVATATGESRPAVHHLRRWLLEETEQLPPA